MSALPSRPAHEPTADTPPVAARPSFDAWSYLILTEAKLVFRDTAGLIIPLVLPLLIMVMNGMGSGDGADQAIPEFNGFSAMEAVVVPLTVTMIIAVIGVVNMPSFLATHRKSGVLRRLSTTPANPAMVLIAQVVVSFVQAAIGVGLAIGVAMVAFDVSAPADPALAIGVLLLTAAAMYGIGMLLGATAPTTNSVLAIGLLLFFAMMALAGGFGSRDALPDTLATIGEYLPYGAGMEALQAAWIGNPVDSVHLAVLVGYALVAGGIATLRFRWDAGR